MVDICIAPKFINFNDPDEGYELTALAALGNDDLRVFATTILEPKQLRNTFVAYDVYSTIFMKPWRV